MYNWVLSALVVAVVIHSIDCVCDSSPDCQSLRFREGLSTGAPCCQCRNVRGFRCRRGERFVPIQGLGRCCSDPSRVIRWNEGFIPTSRVSESNTVYFTPRIEREFLVPRRDVLPSTLFHRRRNRLTSRTRRQSRRIRLGRFEPVRRSRRLSHGFHGNPLLGDRRDSRFFRREPVFGPSFTFTGGRNAIQVDRPVDPTESFMVPFVVGGDPAGIVGGDNANSGGRPVPYQAGIRRVLSGRTVHHCGGTIISQYFILTAAHCFLVSSNVNDYRVRVGDLDNTVTERDEQEFRVRGIWQHPDFRAGPMGDFDYDIALVLVFPVNGQYIQFNDNVQIAYLPPRNLRVVPRSECYTSGWGRTTTDPMDGNSDILQVARTDVLDQSGQNVCNTSYLGLITQRMICAGYLDGTPIDTCTGDSGGPLVCVVRSQNRDFNVLVGITSWGSRQCAVRGFPGVYANVQELQDWLYRLIS